MIISRICSLWGGGPWNVLSPSVGGVVIPEMYPVWGDHFWDVLTLGWGVWGDQFWAMLSVG